MLPVAEGSYFPALIKTLWLICSEKFGWVFPLKYVHNVLYEYRESWFKC